MPSGYWTSQEEESPPEPLSLWRSRKPLLQFQWERYHVKDETIMMETVFAPWGAAGCVKWPHTLWLIYYHAV